MSASSATNVKGEWTPPPAPAGVKAAFEEDAPAGLSATAPEFRPAGQGRRRKSRKSRKSRSKTSKTRSRRHRKGGSSCSRM